MLKRIVTFILFMGMALLPLGNSGLSAHDGHGGGHHGGYHGGHHHGGHHHGHHHHHYWWWW